MTCDGAPLEFCGGPDRLNGIFLNLSFLSQINIVLLVYSCSATTGTSTPSASTAATSATTSPTSSSNSAFPNVGPYSYYGCQTEGSNTRALSAKTTAYDSMTLQSCANDCAEYTYCKYIPTTESLLNSNTNILEKLELSTEGSATVETASRLAPNLLLKMNVLSLALVTVLRSVVLVSDSLSTQHPLPLW
jgi:hypothetical protein